MDNTDLFLFESAFARDTYQRMIGKPEGLVRCVFNGVAAREFDSVAEADAPDIRGADLMVDPVARLHAEGRPLTLTLAGDGEEMPALNAQVERLGLSRS